VKCEGLPEKAYDKLNSVCEIVNNLSYYCEANHYNSRIGQLIHHHYNNLEQQSAPSVFKTTIEQSFSDLKAQLEEKIKELSSRIQLLQSNQSRKWMQ